MNMTHHAQARSRQRGIPFSLLQIIEECGCVLHAPGGADEIFFGKPVAIMPPITHQGLRRFVTLTGGRRQKKQ